MDSQEIILSGGNSAESVVRIGQTVHRTKSKNYSFTHAVLKHLEKTCFKWAPRLIGEDEEGREVLSYLEGQVPRGIQLSVDQIKNAIDILRQFHDVLSESELAKDHETICHNDFAPWNIILKDNAIVGVIDFDECAVGQRVDDVAYFIWTFLDIGNTVRADKEQVELVIKLINSYDLINKADFIDALLGQQNRILEFRKQDALYNKDINQREFSNVKILEIEKSIEWVKCNSGDIRKALHIKA